MSDYFTEDLGVYWERTLYTMVGMIAGLYATPALERAIPGFKGAGAYIITTGMGYNIGYTAYVLQERGKRRRGEHEDEHSDEAGDALSEHFFKGGGGKKAKARKPSEGPKEKDPQSAHARPANEPEADGREGYGHGRERGHRHEEGYGGGSDAASTTGYAVAIASAIAYAAILL